MIRGEPDRLHSGAVLIGVHQYRHSDLPRLPAIKQNLVDLTAALTHPTTGILTAKNCKTVRNPASTSAFMTELKTAANQFQDVLIVYYAGHGMRNEIDDKLYLTVQETNPYILKGTAIPYDWVRELIINSTARTRILILDCCYSGLALGAMSGGALRTRDLTVSGTTVITSTPKNRTAMSPRGERYTAFTGELISLLNTGSPFRNEPLTVHTAFRALRANLQSRKLPIPEMLATNDSGYVLLRRDPPSEPLRPPRAHDHLPQAPGSTPTFRNGATTNQAHNQHPTVTQRSPYHHRTKRILIIVLIVSIALCATIFTVRSKLFPNPKTSVNYTIKYYDQSFTMADLSGSAVCPFSDSARDYSGVGADFTTDKILTVEANAFLSPNSTSAELPDLMLGNCAAPETTQQLLWNPKVLKVGIVRGNPTGPACANAAEQSSLVGRLTVGSLAVGAEVCIKKSSIHQVVLLTLSLNSANNATSYLEWTATSWLANSE